MSLMESKRFCFVISGLVLVLLGLHSGAQAATFTVSSLNDTGDGSLRAAVTAANATSEADTITFATGLAGTITLQSPLPDIKSPLTLQGPGADVITLDVNHTGRLLTFPIVNIGKRAHTISGLTLTGGGGGDKGFSAMLIWSGNAVTVENCLVTKNATVSAHGGAFAVQSGAELTIKGSTVSHNAAYEGAGVTIQGSGKVTIDNSTFHDNIAGNAGGGVRAQLTSGASITILNSTLRNNSATEGHGGAIYVDQADLAVRNTTFYQNTAGRSGGALYFYNKSTSSIVQSTIVANTADMNSDGDGDGGGIGFGEQTGDTSNIKITLIRSIVGKNLDAGKQANDCAATVTLIGANFVTDGTGCLFQGSGAPNLGVDPKLQDTPALHGGATMAFAPAPNSPLINAGPADGCTDELGALMATDQRGFARSDGPACDIGAVEQVCGDGELFGNESCDDGNTINTDACLNTCVKAQCGDGVVGPAESCDDGNAISGDGCQSNCALPTCGDGTVDAGEACEDGNADNTDACLNTCAAAVCGDGFLRAGVEQCDNGASNSDTVANACRMTCVPAKCGDGAVDTGEACDDGNLIDDDACSNACKVKAPEAATVEPEAPTTSPSSPASVPETPTVPAPAAPAAASSGGCSLVF